MFYSHTAQTAIAITLMRAARTAIDMAAIPQPICGLCLSFAKKGSHCVKCASILDARPVGPSPDAGVTGTGSAVAQDSEFKRTLEEVQRDQSNTVQLQRMINASEPRDHDYNPKGRVWTMLVIASKESFLRGTLINLCGEDIAKPIEDFTKILKKVETDYMKDLEVHLDCVYEQLLKGLTWHPSKVDVEKLRTIQKIQIKFCSELRKAVNGENNNNSHISRNSSFSSMGSPALTMAEVVQVDELQDKEESDGPVISTHKRKPDCEAALETDEGREHRAADFEDFWSVDHDDHERKKLHLVMEFGERKVKNQVLQQRAAHAGLRIHHMEARPFSPFPEQLVGGNLDNEHLDNEQLTALLEAQEAQDRAADAEPAKEGDIVDPTNVRTVPFTQGDEHFFGAMLHMENYDGKVDCNNPTALTPSNSGEYYSLTYN